MKLGFVSIICIFVFVETVFAVNNHAISPGKQILQAYTSANNLGDFVKPLYPQMSKEEQSFLEQKLKPFITQPLPKLKFQKNVLSFTFEGNFYSIDTTKSSQKIYRINNRNLSFSEKSLIEIYNEIERALLPIEASILIPKAHANPIVAAKGLAIAVVLAIGWEIKIRHDVEVDAIEFCEKTKANNQLIKKERKKMTIDDMKEINTLVKQLESKKEDLSRNFKTDTDAYRCTDGLIKSIIAIFEKSAPKINEASESKW